VRREAKEIHARWQVAYIKYGTNFLDQLVQHLLDVGILNSKSAVSQQFISHGSNQ
jgi:hypothetical protein